VYKVLMNQQPGTSSGPLDGLRILELGSFIAGPFAGQLLGDYGADVVKVESPGGGDPMRQWGVVAEGESLWWPSLARNKRSVAIDLRTEDGRDLVRRMAREVDVVLENFRPGTLTRWGLDYPSLSAANPGLIMVHVSGFGQTGPRSGDAGFGSIGEAMGGLRHTTGYPDRAPSRCGISMGDSLAAMFAVIGTMAAVVERQRSGRGQEVDVAIYEAVAAIMESSMADHEVGGVTRGRTGSMLPGVAPSNVYPTRDGSDVLIAANADTVFGRLCQAMGRPDLVSDERYATHGPRGVNATELDELIAGWTASLDAEELLAVLEEHGVPGGRIYTAADVLRDPHYLAREMILRIPTNTGGEIPTTGIVPKFGRTPGAVRASGPEIGAHTVEVLRELARVDGEELDRLIGARVVAT
jgi:formyl-CoA transferase/succinyl-CoA--D-citramalate CoA-transferase